jgi:hypothetical protein
MTELFDAMLRFCNKQNSCTECEMAEDKGSGMNMSCYVRNALAVCKKKLGCEYDNREVVNE